MSIYTSQAMFQKFTGHLSARPADLFGAQCCFNSLTDMAEGQPPHDLCAKAARLLVDHYGEARYFSIAQRTLECMALFDDTDAVRIERAIATCVLLVDYVNAGQMQEAMSLFATLQRMGTQIEVLEECAQAAAALVHGWVRAGNRRQAEAIYAGMETFGSSQAMRAAREQAAQVLSN